MDAIDIALRDAWNRVWERIRDDPEELERRERRAGVGIVRRPVRPWCLCIRASDTRIERWLSEPEVAKARLPHSVHLSKWAIEALTGPVYIPWPGMDWVEAAQLLGRHEESIRGWIAAGVFHVDRIPAIPMGKRGKPVPSVWARGALDPNGPKGRPPDGVWGDMWIGLAHRLPTGYTAKLDRVPRARPYRDGEERGRGWRWVCPGRIIPLPAGMRPPAEAIVIEEDGMLFLRKRCGRLCSKMYLPLPAWTMQEHSGAEELAALRAARTAWVDWETPAFPACHRCWRVQGANLVDRQGWNLFVTHVSGGLLYGHEAPRDEALAPLVRRRAYRPSSARAPSERRAQVLERLLRGRMYKEIATELGVGYGTVHQHVKKLYREHEVHSRAELIAKLGGGGGGGAGEEAGVRLRLAR